MHFFEPIAGKTKIKICGLSTEKDVDTAVELAIDALGLVFYPPSIRYLSPEKAGPLSYRSQGKVQNVALVVDPSDALVHEIKTHCAIDIWQFHGNESEARCQAVAGSTPWMKAARISEKFNLDEFCLQYRSAHAWLFDAMVEGYGGGGKTFNWDSIPQIWVKENAHRVVLSGGLNVNNITEAIAHFQPMAVDVSSGVELAPGKKDPELMKEFVLAVRQTDK